MFKVLRDLHQGPINVLRVLEHHQAAYRAVPTLLRRSGGLDQDGVVRESLLGNVRPAFWGCHPQACPLLSGSMARFRLLDLYF